MAGSIKWFVYTTDNGTDFAISADESNVEAVAGGTQDYVTGLTVRFAIPRNLTPRYAYYSDPTGSRTIRVPILTQALYNGILTGAPTISDPIGALTLNLVRIQPEKIKLPRADDTGLNDGDTT